jgi:outer membrane lipoprotein-sorting protein
MNSTGGAVKMIAGSFLIVSVLGVGSTNAQLTVLLKKMEAHYRGLTTLRADVQMDQFDATLGDHDHKRGKIIYLPGKNRSAAFRIDWTEPIIESIGVVNGQYRIYRSKIRQAYKGSVNDAAKQKGADGALSILNMPQAELREKFDMTVAGGETVANGVATTHLVLVPKRPATYRSADVWVDVDGMPVQMRQTETNGSYTVILLSNSVKNKKLDTRELIVEFPPDVKPI